MAKEKIIYLGPEEELTSVRERLENATDGRIILVIPAQTQLLSRVGWMLLHSHVRKLGKDVLIISSNRQIRAASKAAGFRVANSLESLPSYRPRPSNRPVRSDTSGKTSQGINKQGSSGNKDTRPLRSRRGRKGPWSSPHRRLAIPIGCLALHHTLPVLPARGL